MHTWILLTLMTLAQAQVEINDPFTIAITAGDVQAVKEALTHGSSWKSKTKAGMPALILAAQSGQTEVVRALLSDPLQRSAYSLETPLTDEHQRTALFAAAEHGHLSTVEALLSIANESLRAKVTPVVRRPANDPQFEPSQGAVGDLVASIARANVLINTPNENGMTALMFAAKRGWVDVVDAMLNNGAIAGIRDKNGSTASSLAQSAGYPALAARLRAEEQPQAGR